MAVIGAKGNFAGPGASFDETDDKDHEIVCSQVSMSTRSLINNPCSIIYFSPGGYSECNPTEHSWIVWSVIKYVSHSYHFHQQTFEEV